MGLGPPCNRIMSLKGNTLDHPLIYTREPCLTKPTD
jgi:hypothetical protein